MESNDIDLNSSDFNFENLSKINISASFFDKQEILENEKPKIKKTWHPRPYQQQIYEKALNQNSIIYAETGRGKTFISIMLMAHHLGIDIKKKEENPKIDKNKKIIFFVCNTSLINQQKNHIKEILNVEVGTIQGKKDTKSKSDYEAFLNKWNSFNIFVAIPEIVYKFLSCGFINIFQITMLVFDECHNTTADHPYNKIMNEFYFFYKKEKKVDESKYKFPIIYGLTASPLKTRIGGNSNIQAATDALIKLCENLDCVAVIDPDMIYVGEEEKEKDKNKNVYVEIKTHDKSEGYKDVVNELKILFKQISALAFSLFPKKYKNNNMKEYLKPYLIYVMKKFIQVDLVNYNNICQENINLYNLKSENKLLYIFEELQRHIFLILENLGLDSLIIYFEKVIQLYDKAYQKKLEKEEEENESSDDSTNVTKLKESEDSDTDDEEELLLNLDAEIILKLKGFIQSTNDNLQLKKNEGKLNYISDRLTKLYNTLEELDKSKIIIFIANRIIAHILQPTLSRYLNKNFPNKKCEEVIGVNKRTKKRSLTLTPSITLNKLNQIIKEFNEDKFDILIGTSAIEEGLDIQSCNSVISLVEIQTPKSYIQMRGRARKTNSKFYIFSYSQEETKSKVKNFLEIGAKMKELFDNGIIKDFKRKNFIQDKKDFIYYIFIELTHAKLTLNNASVFFNEIKQQMENYKVKFSCEIKVSAIPNQEQKFIGKMKIETNLSNINKKYQSDICNSKDEAKKMCQYNALVNLIQNKYLDEHLKFCKENVKNL